MIYFILVFASMQQSADKPKILSMTESVYMTTWEIQNYGYEGELSGCHWLEWQKVDYKGAKKNLRGQLC